MGCGGIVCVSREEDCRGGGKGRERRTKLEKNLNMKMEMESGKWWSARSPEGPEGNKAWRGYTIT